MSDADLDNAFFTLARWIASPAGTHGDTGDRAIRALRCLKVSTVADQAESLIASADDPATLDRWRKMTVDRDPAEAHLLHLLDQRTRWLRECEQRFKELGITPPHSRAHLTSEPACDPSDSPAGPVDSGD
ncbi:MAG TPA: hypothetical protein VFJ76_07645 [Solirubrobacterales bacterium]|nr:hypothetical protein [Solirubrobacterales bacterium]